MHLHGTVADQFYEEIVRKAGGNFFSLSNTGETVPYLLKEIESVRMGKTYQRYEAGSFLYQFLCSLLREVEGQTMPVKNCAVRGHEWLERNFTSDRSLSEMCEELRVSLSHFSRQFRDVYGISPMKYLTHLRLEFSRQLLLNTTLSIQEISAVMTDVPLLRAVILPFFTAATLALLDDHITGSSVFGFLFTVRFKRNSPLQNHLFEKHIYSIGKIKSQSLQEFNCLFLCAFLDSDLGG